MAVNLRDFPPLASRHRSDLAGGDLAKWESLYQAAGELQAGNRWPEALGQYEAASKIDDRFAELQFHIGECLMKTGGYADARGRFELARDLDALRFRADSRINAIVREVAGEQATAGVRLVDAEQVLAQSDSGSKGVLGKELFYEHVHLTFEGNYLLARAVFDQVRAALPQLAATNGRQAIPSRQRCTELLALTPWDESQLVADMVDLTSKKPFSRQFDYDRRQAAARQRRDALRKLASTPEAKQAAWSTYEAALAKAPDDWCLHRHCGMLAMELGRADAAVEHLQFAIQKVPWDGTIHNDLGMALAGQGRIDEAIGHYQAALEINPDDMVACFNLGVALANRGQAAEAVGQLRKSLEIAPDFAPPTSSWPSCWPNTERSMRPSPITRGLWRSSRTWQ